MGFEERLSRHLAKRREKGLYRELPSYRLYGDNRIINLAGNDYLGLSRHPAIKEACARAARDRGAGNCASRLISGNHPDYQRLEEKLSQWLNREVLVFGSGFLANVGVLSCIAGRHDVFFADKLVHRSIIEGMKLSGARIERFSHNDMDDLKRLLERKRGQADNAFIVTEGLFSMTGSVPPWQEIVHLKKAFDCHLYVDEAHSIGVWGPDGKGLAAAAGCLDEIDIFLGTFGKGWGNYGSFLAATSLLKDYLVNFAPSLIYSTALPPSVLAGIQASWDVITSKEGEKRREKLRENIEYFCEKYKGRSLKRRGNCQIQALMAEDIKTMLKAHAYLKEAGYITAAIRPPTVPPGMAMIRLSLHAEISKKQMSELTEVLNMVDTD